MLVCAGLAAHGVIAAQVPAESHAKVPALRVIDGRLESALRLLVAGSPRAAGVLESLAASGLPVAIGTPAELAALPDAEGGPAPEERRALLAEPGAKGMQDEPPIAWVVFRVAPPPSAAGGKKGGEDVVERVWLAVEVDSIERWIRATGWSDAEDRIQADLLATLAHEFVAHVGSIAGTRDVFPTSAMTRRRRRTAARASQVRLPVPFASRTRYAGN